MNPPTSLWLAIASLQGSTTPAAGEEEAAPALTVPDVGEMTEHASKWVEMAQDWAIRNGPGIVAGILVLIFGRWFAKAIANLVRKVMEKRRVDATLASFAHSMIYMTLMTLVVITAIDTMGFETTSFVAVLGAATLAIGFALQGSLGNFASGVMLIVFRPFKGGDFIEAAGQSGIVEEIGVFATKLRTGDNKQMIIPNGSITAGTITNYSAKDTRRVDCVFGIGYGDDIKKAKTILEEVLKKDERILADPAPTIGVLALADSSVNIACRPWVKTADYWPVFFALQETVKTEFDKADITIPFPQRDVHMHQVA